MTGSISIIPREGHIKVDGEVIDEADGPSPRIIINILGGESIVNDVETDAASKLTAFGTQDGTGNIWSIVFGTPKIQILALYLDFEDAKNIHVLQVLFWGFGG